MGGYNLENQKDWPGWVDHSGNSKRATNGSSCFSWAMEYHGNNLYIFMCVSQRIYKTLSHLSSAAGGPAFYYVFMTRRRRLAQNKFQNWEAGHFFFFRLHSLPINPMSSALILYLGLCLFRKLLSNPHPSIILGNKMTLLTGFDVTFLK